MRERRTPGADGEGQSERDSAPRQATHTHNKVAKLQPQLQPSPSGFLPGSLFAPLASLRTRSVATSSLQRQHDRPRVAPVSFHPEFHFIKQVFIIELIELN